MLVMNGDMLTDLVDKAEKSFTRSFTAVVGDESAGKTVLVTALLGQVILQVLPGVGTTVRTLIGQVCDLNQVEDFLCDLSYKDPFNGKGMTTDDLLKRYVALSSADVQEPVRRCFEQTLDDFFTGHEGRAPCENASVLLCHALDTPASIGASCTRRLAAAR